MDYTSIGALQSLGALEGGGLACTVCAEKCCNGTAIGGEIHPIEHADHFSVVSGDRPEVLEETFDAQAWIGGKHFVILRHVVRR
ncbi:hypothetical protein GCM10009611_07440 [Arthrobacter roseus]